jgi:hypothetical protein
MLTREAIFKLLSKAYKKMKYSSGRKPYNAFVSKYYKKHKRDNFVFMKNIWSKNYLWDYFLQSLPHCAKSEYYVPADYYAFEIEPKLNREFTCFCSEKNMFDRIFTNSGVKLPKTILRCMNGVYLDRNYMPVDDIKSFCKHIREDIIVKPTVNTCGGKGIRKYSFEDETLYLYNERNQEFSVEEVTAYYNSNFIIQGLVNQAPEVAQFHPYSLNTVRAFSYRSVKTNKTHITTAMFRMGVDGSYLDNVSMNGIACGIRKNGYLMRYAFDQFGNYYICHPNTRIKFENCSIPAFEKVAGAIKSLADVIPHQRLIGWDFGIDKNKRPVLIEVNVGTGAWMQQVACGTPLFGNYSQEVKDYMDADS